MDEQEVTENSSEDSAEDQLHDSAEIIFPLPEPEEPGAEQSAAGLDERDDAGEPGFTIKPEELPTMQWSDIDAELAEFEALEGGSVAHRAATGGRSTGSAETGPLDGLEDAMSWLEQLAAGQGMPIDEMPTLVTAQPVEENLPQELPENPEMASEELYQAPAAELPIDSDPMAWLEQLAVDQSSPLEELPSVADRLLASEIISQTEIPPESTINDPYDVDQALSYLEQLAVAQGLDLSDVSFDREQPVSSLDEALSIIDGMALAGLVATSMAGRQARSQNNREAAAVIVEEDARQELPKKDPLSDLSAEMPADPQQALDWLSDFGEEGDEPSAAIVEEADTVAPTADLSESSVGDAIVISESDLVELEKASVESQIDNDVLQEMPDDPDEAVAWMENLASRGSQSASARDDVAAAPGPAVGSSKSLLEARDALERGELKQAISLYQVILEEDSVSDELLAALEEAAALHADSPGLLRLLGDAYMQNDEVDKAIATYRKGFDHLQ